MNISRRLVLGCAVLVAACAPATVATNVMRATVGRASIGGVKVTAANCPDTVVFLLDLSGSMQGKQEISISRSVTGAARRAGGSVNQQFGRAAGDAARRTFGLSVNRLTAAKMALNSALAGLYVPARPHNSPGQRDRRPPPTAGARQSPAYFALFGFNSGVEAWQPGVQPATDLVGATHWIAGRPANGGTAIRAALQAAFAVRGARAIYLLSDGEPTDASAETILAEVRQWNRARPPGRFVRIHTIGVGDQQGEPFLCQLAQENNGTYTYDGEVRCGRRPLVAFVGGNNDEHHRNMANTYCAFQFDGLDKAYFAWDQQDALVRAIRERRRNFPGASVAIVGHSWGGDTGYDAAGELGRQGSPVNLLITLDPVSRLKSGQLPRPAGVQRWVNVYIPGTNSLCDLVAGAGRAWGRQDAAGADNVPAARSQAADHCHAAGMLYNVPRARGALQALPR